MQLRSNNENGKAKYALPKRKNLRLPEYDYAQEGMYFVTVCTHDKACLFGDIVNDEMVLIHGGKMVERWYNKLEKKFSNIQCDMFVCMPNHIHFIVNIVGADLCVRPDETEPQISDRNISGSGAHTGAPLQTAVQWFKTMTTNAYIHGVKQHEWQPFHGKLWQRNYFERVIRNERELHQIREYIVNNPLKWALDRENPDYALHPRNQS